MKEEKEKNQEEIKSEAESTPKNAAQETAAPENITVARSEYEGLLKKIKEFESSQDRLLRSAADFDNAKKRLVKEKEDFFRFALEGILYEMLPILDNFERALAHRVDDPAQKAMWSGIDLIYKHLKDTLKNHGLARIDALRKPFDPHYHEAVGHIVSEQEMEGMIAEEIVAGYILNGKLLRPAKVKVFSKAELGLEKEEELT